MKIVCVGRNYEDHIKELNHPVPEEPIFFLKPDSAIIKNNKPFFNIGIGIHNGLHQVDAAGGEKRRGIYIP